MLTRECPFGNNKDILHCKYIFPDKIYDILSENFKDFITYLFDLNVNTRYSALQCLNHPWIKN